MNAKQVVDSLIDFIQEHHNHHYISGIINKKIQPMAVAINTDHGIKLVDHIRYDAGLKCAVIEIKSPVYQD